MCSPAVGFGGTALASVDDGVRQQLEVPGGGALWCCRAHGDGALIGGELLGARR